jgi:hypothetical protein
MTDKVIEIHSIASAAAGWKRSRDREPIACFALVTTAAMESLSITEKVVIPLVAEDMVFGLVGRDVDPQADAVEFCDAEGI